MPGHQPLRLGRISRTSVEPQISEPPEVATLLQLENTNLLINFPQILHSFKFDKSYRKLQQTTASDSSTIVRNIVTRGSLHCQQLISELGLGEVSLCQGTLGVDQVV